MTLYEFFKDSVTGDKGSPVMWTTTKIISDFVESHVDESERDRLMEQLYAVMSDGHFNRYFADKSISSIVYVDRDGISHAAPYWTDSVLEKIYDTRRDEIRPYNFDDFRVVMNMTKADNQNKLERWFPGIGEDEMLSKIIDEAVNWLDDGDNPYGNNKVFGYFYGLRG